MSRPATVDEAFEEFPFDFCAYLARRLDLSRGEAASLLGDWMRAYEPERARRPGLAPARPSEPPPQVQATSRIAATRAFAAA